MRQADVDDLQSAVWSDLGESVLIHRADSSGVPALSVAVFLPAGSVDSGGDNIELRTEADQFSFRRSDTAAIEAARRGAIIERTDTGTRYRVAGAGPFRGEQHRVVVNETSP